MPIYTQKNTLQIAKRYQNKKRNYLLINPLQAKHIPVSPSQSLEMMQTFGQLLSKKYPQTNLIIGFAETATAIGATVASCFSNSCIYCHTTRESIPQINHWIEFSEEHSHAVEQKLFADRLQEWISQSETILLIEDEISTGKTLMNMIQQLKRHFPILCQKKIVAASILNRVSPDNLKKLEKAGIICESLVQLEQIDYTSLMEKQNVQSALPVKSLSCKPKCTPLSPLCYPDPRRGVRIGDYTQSCQQIAQDFICQYKDILQSYTSLLVLGTEECMYPALIMGQKIEQEFAISVRCHATTRSPIGICLTEQYPITNGYKVSSFYSSTRETYIYNLKQYDAVIIVTETLANHHLKGINSFMAALQPYGIKHLFCLQGGTYVWHI